MDAAIPPATEVSADDQLHLLRAIEVARRSRAHGNHPFGAIVVTVDGRVIEGENTVVTEGDPTGHAETNLVRLAAREVPREELHAATLYTSTEPCAMCSGAIYWAGIHRVVYALPEQQLAAMVPEQHGERTMDLPCREVFAAGGSTVAVAGPALLEEAAEVHAGFWNGRDES